MVTDRLNGYRDQVRRWLAENLDATSVRARRDRGELPASVALAEERALQRRLYDAGFAGIEWPSAYGGQGLSAEHARAFEEEATAYRTPDFSPLQNTTFAVCAPTMLAHASPDFLAEHIPRILAGDELWAQFFSEPGAGSDLAAVRTRAVRDGDEWIISGSKIWSSGATIADYGMCLARTDSSLPKHDGLTWFAVPTDAPGLTIQPIRESNGGLEFCEEFFDDVRVSDDQRIGPVNRGWDVTRTMLAFERSAGKTHAARLGGPPGDLPDDLVELAERRGLTGDPRTRQEIARVHANDFVQRHLGEHIACRMAEGAGAEYASFLSLAEGEFTAQRAQVVLEIGGPAAIAWSPDDAMGRSAATAYLNARIRAIAGGTNEMQRNAIGERVLGLPREPSADRGVPFNQLTSGQ